MCFDNDDAPDIYDQTEVKTRKPHRCAGCRKIIPAGSRMSYTRSLFDGQLVELVRMRGLQADDPVNRC